MEFAPYLFVTGGRCEEALKFYKDVFGGNFEVAMRWKDGPPDAGMPAAMGDRVMHATFDSSAVKFMASDAQPTTTYGDSAVSLSIGTSDVNEGKRLFDRLSQGGKVEMPFEKTFWGAMFGMLTDKYGFDWMVNCRLAQ